ncbi:MAG: hypothetical protein IAE80_12040 [Anaerolinea sp.]|nr:hypothetical protein [Anaerolinea sp.]
MFNRRSGRGVPNLVVAQRVIDKMAAAANTHMEDETGEAMVGFFIPGLHTNGVPTLYVLDTISPDDSAVRQFHTFQQGDERQDELIWWLQENWRVQRKKGQTLIGKVFPSKWDVPLRYLGDWHKQPGFMIQPSGGDLMTALDWIEDEDNNTDFLLAPIVTLDHPHTIIPSNVTTNFLMIPQTGGEAMRVDFWYIDKHVSGFLPIAPVIYPNEQLPTLAEYPWHLIDEERFARENQLLREDNLFISVILHDADEHPPLEICFLSARVGGDKLIIVVTAADYPKTPPRVRVAPYIHMQPNDDMYKVFEQAWKASEPVTLGIEWTPESTLLDVIKMAEAKTVKS